MREISRGVVVAAAPMAMQPVRAPGATPKLWHASQAGESSRPVSLSLVTCAHSLGHEAMGRQDGGNRDKGSKKASQPKAAKASKAKKTLDDIDFELGARES